VSAVPSSLAAHQLPRPINREAVVATLVAAFAKDEAVRTLYPSEAEYRRHFPGFMIAFGGRAFDAGVVDEDYFLRAAALWFPPGIEPDGEAILAYLEATMPPERLAMLGTGMEIQNAMHPQQPHWYLPWMGVRRDAQGNGVGSALLANGLARVDADGLPAYLEATNWRNAAFYARYGFEVMGVVEAPGYPEIVAMWRPARSVQLAA
jgi:ribosomal protein S18 acetylase RimI-like enzyme